MSDKERKLRFYDRTFWIMIISFILVYGSLFIVPENSLEHIGFLIPWYLFLISGIVCELIFIVGMIINAYKLKKYGWVVAIILLGTIFPIIFYFSEFRNKLKKKGK